MKAQEIMTRKVVTVSQTTPVREVAHLMTTHRISGIPVVAKNGAVVGIISESDLLHRSEIGTEPRRKWWLTFFSDPDAMAREYTKSHGLKAKDIMTRPVVSVADDTELNEIADTLQSRKIKRVPVLCDDKLVGIISRADIVRALSQAPAATPASAVEDDALQQKLVARMRDQDWLDGTFLNVVVRNGIVELRGFIASAEQRRALLVLVEETSGVLGVDDQLTVGLPVMRAG